MLEEWLLLKLRDNEEIPPLGEISLGKKGCLICEAASGAVSLKRMARTGGEVWWVRQMVGCRKRSFLNL